MDYLKPTTRDFVVAGITILAFVVLSHIPVIGDVVKFIFGV